jgi:hypothetical protein
MLYVEVQHLMQSIAAFPLQISVACVSYHAHGALKERCTQLSAV